VEVAIRPPEQLVATAHSQHGRPGLDGAANTIGLRDEIPRDKGLLAILAASHVQKIVLARAHGVADAQRRHLELVAAPRRAPVEHRDVAAVRIDVQVVRIEMSDPKPHAARSQYGRTNPRRATILRSASIAV